MSGYVRDIVIKKTFEGDSVTLVLRPISFGEMLDFTKYLQTGKDGKGKLDIPVNDLPKLFSSMKPYVKTFTGLKTHDATDVTTDELFDAAYFSDFLTDALLEWITKGTPSNPPSPGASPSA